MFKTPLHGAKSRRGSPHFEINHRFTTGLQRRPNPLFIDIAAATLVMHMSSSSTAEIRDRLIDSAAHDGELISASRALTLVQSFLRNRFSGPAAIRIYEAGGGSLSYLPPELLDKADITVVDIDDKQIKNNKYAKTKICGDIQTQEFPSGSFDLVSCYFVIEHIERPDKAIRHFLDALAPNGLAFIAAPNPNSFSGLVAKYTPHWFHVWFYRVPIGNKTAGLPGNGPFPVVYHPLVAPEKLIAFIREHGFEIVYFRQFESVQLGKLRDRHPFLAAILNLFIGGLETISRRTLREGEFHIVMKKPAARQSCTELTTAANCSETALECGRSIKP